MFPGWDFRDIQRWSALIQNNFRSVSPLFINWKSLNSAENENFQSWRLALNSADFWRIQNDNFWLIFQFFRNFQKYLNFVAHNSDWQPNLRKVNNKNLVVNLLTGQRYDRNRADQRWCFPCSLKNVKSLIQRWLSLDFNPGFYEMKFCYCEWDLCSEFFHSNRSSRLNEVTSFSWTRQCNTILWRLQYFSVSKFTFRPNIF